MPKSKERVGMHYIYVNSIGVVTIDCLVEIGEQMVVREIMAFLTPHIQCVNAHISLILRFFSVQTPYLWTQKTNLP